MAKKFKFELGMEVKDKYTPFTGIVMCRSEYLTGCIQYSVMSQTLDKDGEPATWLNYDESRLKKVRQAVKKKKGDLGGPQPIAKCTNR